MMRQIFCLLFLNLIFCSAWISYSQGNNDSLWKIYHDKSQTIDSRLHAIDDIAWNYLSISPDSSYIFAQEELKIAKTIHSKKISLKWQATALKNIGISFICKSDYPKALEYHFKSLKLKEEIGDIKEIALSYIYIGNVYYDLSDYAKTLDYYKRSLKIFEKVKDKRGVAGSLGNIASVYLDKFDYPKALNYQFRSLKMFEEIDDKEGLAFAYSNIGLLYLHLSNYQKALDYQLKSFELENSMNDKKGIAYSLGNIGEIYLKLKKYDLALKHSLKAVKLCKEIGALDSEKNFQKTLYEIYKAKGESTKALEHFERMILLRDSIFKTENQKQILLKEINYEFEKKQAIAKVNQDKKDSLVKKENQKQSIILFSVIIGLFLVVVLSIFLFNRFRITQKQKSIIEKQKYLIEEHQKEMIDSITYAKRIQNAILPPTELIKEKLSNIFVLYKPKDIVAGDFYWMEEINDTILIAVADCTGHGVPGAMVSVVCSNALDRAVKEFHLIDTGKILDKVTTLVKETFEKNTSEVNDGMDISILSINKMTKKIQWSGANNPLWYFNNNELHEIKADKQPIGKNDHHFPFMTHIVDYVINTTFYLFTDGFSDQFGGPKGKKFRNKQFQEILLNSSVDDLYTQQNELDKAFQNWKGDLEQVDDVCIIGIRL